EEASICKLHHERLMIRCCGSRPSQEARGIGRSRVNPPGHRSAVQVGCSRGAAFIAALATLLTAPGTAADFILVSDGRARAEIVIDSRDPAAPLRFAAEELERYVKAMSGASLPRRASRTGQQAP